MKVRSFMRHAGEFTPVEVELSLAPGLPQISFLGMPDPFIRESVTRIKSALRSQGFDFPKGQQVIVQLRPGYLKKTSRGLDLAVAAALIWEMEQAKAPEKLSSLNLYGELSLRGEVFVPDDIDDSQDCINSEDVIVTGPSLSDFEGTIWPLNSLSDLRNESVWKKVSRETVRCERPKSKYSHFTSQQAELIKVLAAGSHPALFVGTPGSGKSATAESVNPFLPAPSPDEWREISRIASLFYKKATWRPKVVVHHTITPLAMTGGGGQIKPGEITRAHGGTLIMDELLEFKPGIQDSLREPLESGTIEIARNGRNQRLAANFQLIATSNLCRCGKYFPKDSSQCRCSKHRLKTYQEKFSGPVLDRFAVISLFSKQNAFDRKTIGVDEILKSVVRATDQRLSRNQTKSNSKLTFEELKTNLYCSEEKIDLFTMGVTSQRAALHVLQVARTLADLEGSEKTKRDHFNRALELVVVGRTKLIDSLEF